MEQGGECASCFCGAIRTIRYVPVGAYGGGWYVIVGVLHLYCSQVLGSYKL